MLKRFLPREEKFFTLFSKAAQELVNAVSEFNELLHDLTHAKEHAALISLYEKTADTITNNIFECLHKTFITPFDHFDIQQITIKLDNIVDAIHGAAQRIALYEIKELPRELESIGATSIRLSKLVVQNINLLPDLKNSEIILTNCEGIALIKHEKKNSLRLTIAELLNTEADMRQLLKLKDIYESSKLIMDNFEDFSNVIKSIILEYS